MAQPQTIDLSEPLALIEKGRYAEAIASFKSMDTVGTDIQYQALWLFYLGYSHNLNDQQDEAYNYMQKAKSL